MFDVRKVGLSAVLALLLVVPANASATTAEGAVKRCQPVRDVPALDGSRYEGSDIYRVRALNISCRTARRVAVRGMLRGMFLGAAGESYMWRRWQVRRDLMGPVDSYRAAVPATEKRVRWLFGGL